MYQDFDIAFFANDVAPFWDNMEWIEEKFGLPSLYQKPESMELIPPDNDGNYFYLMIFSDCCSDFYWFLNNVAKGIARDELSYAMEMLNYYVRATYSNADYDNMWKAAFDMLYLFGDVARMVAAKLDYTYDEFGRKRNRGLYETGKR